VTEPRFKPGDRVTVRHGKGHVWRIVHPHDFWPGEPGYVLEDGMRQRTAGESALTLHPETAADREAWLERHRDA